MASSPLQTDGKGDASPVRIEHFNVAGLPEEERFAALVDFGPASIAQLDFDLRRDRRDARAGIAAATAMGYAPMPSQPGRTSWVLNGALFRDAQAIGGAFAHRLAIGTPFAVTGGFAYGGNGNNTVRVGLAGEF